MREPGEGLLNESGIVKLRRLRLVCLARGALLQCVLQDAVHHLLLVLQACIVLAWR